jgi:predicted O-methyltransferase YrrM
MKPSGLRRVIQEVTKCSGGTVVECGGGTSTLYLGQALKTTGKHLVTVEHDPEWATHLRELLGGAGLAATVTILTAPLTPFRSAPLDTLWYDTDVLAAFLAGRSIAVLIVDGPPAYKPEWRHARYPAAPFFDRYLCAGALVILDDVDRPGERAIMHQWHAEYGLDLKPARPWQRIALGRKPHAPRGDGDGRSAVG